MMVRVGVGVVRGGGKSRCILGAQLSTADLLFTDYILQRRFPMNRMGAVV